MNGSIWIGLTSNRTSRGQKYVDNQRKAYTTLSPTHELHFALNSIRGKSANIYRLRTENKTITDTVSYKRTPHLGYSFTVLFYFRESLFVVRCVVCVSTYNYTTNKNECSEWTVQACKPASQFLLFQEEVQRWCVLSKIAAAQATFCRIRWKYSILHWFMQGSPTRHKPFYRSSDTALSPQHPSSESVTNICTA